MRVDGLDQLEVELVDQLQVAVDLLQHRIDDQRLAAAPAGEQIGVGARDAVEELAEDHGLNSPFPHMLHQVAGAASTRKRQPKEGRISASREGKHMPSKIVDLSARSEIIRNEPFGLHFWECQPAEYLTFLKDPRTFLAKMGLKLAKDVRIEDRDRKSRLDQPEHRQDAAAGGGWIVCNVGGGNVGIERKIYRIISYGHKDEDIGKFRKRLLHAPDEQERSAKPRKVARKKARR